ncbi:MAG: secretin N-terminal domain-containing protein [Planctomycetota bacterium]
MRALFPLIALVGVIALPATLAQEQTTKESVAPIVHRQPNEPRQSAIVRLTHAEAYRMSKAFAEVFSMEPTPSCGPFKIIADTETNSLVMTGSAEAIAKARTMLKELDQAPVASRQTEIIRLKHARAKDLADILMRVSSHGNPGPGEVHSGITVDERTASLILTGDPAPLVALKVLIETLDIPMASNDVDASNSTRARITVYQVDVSQDQAASLSASSLTAFAKDDPTLKAGLTKIGQTNHLYTLDQAIDLDSNPTLQINSTIPVPSGSTKQADGTEAPQVSYQSVGCIANFGGASQFRGSKPSEVRLSLEIAAIRNSIVNPAADHNAPIIHKLQQSFNGPRTFNQPIILVSLESSPARETSTAYVTRIEFTKPAARG